MVRGSYHDARKRLIGVRKQDASAGVISQTMNEVWDYFLGELDRRTSSRERDRGTTSDFC